MRSPFTSSCHMTCDFKVKGDWAAGYHTGEDWVYVNKQNTKLVSPCTGVIIRNECSESYGNFIVIQSRFDDLVILMAHLKKPSSFKVGSSIFESEYIGQIGSSGKATGNHLHIEIENGSVWKYNRNLIKPSDLINFQDHHTYYFSHPRVWTNGTTKEYVYASVPDCQSKRGPIGNLYPYERASCYGIVDGCYLIVYQVNGHKHKTGFVKYSGKIK